MLQYMACCKMSIDDKHIVGWQNKELLLKIKNSLSGLPVWACDCCQLAIRHYTRSESCMWYLIFVISYMCKNTCGHELARNDCREVNGFSCGKNHLTFHMDILLPCMICREVNGFSCGKNHLTSIWTFFPWNWWRYTWVLPIYPLARTFVLFGSWNFMESSFTKPWTILDPALSSSAILTSLGVLCSLVLCSCGWANHFSSET